MTLRQKCSFVWQKFKHSKIWQHLKFIRSLYCSLAECKHLHQQISN